MEKYREKKKNTASVVIAGIFALYLFYYSYRYILQMNSDLTSPTYSPTPFGIQFAKYAILAVFCILLFFSVVRYRLHPYPAIPYLIIVLLTIQNIYTFLLIGSVNSMIAVLCFLPVLITLCVDVRIDCGAMIKVGDVFLYFTILYELLQIALYLFVGRLPALAYPTGELTDVRFGGAWDDPNGFAVLLAYFLPYSVFRFKGVKRIVLVALLSIFMLLTWSMTGIAAFLAVCLIGGIVYLVKHPDLVIHRSMAIAFTVIVFAVIAVAVYLSTASRSFNYFITSKIGSIQGHLDGWNIADLSIGCLLGITPSGERPETSIVALIDHGGLLHMVLFYVLGIIVLKNAYLNLSTAQKKTKERPFFIGVLFYEAVFLIATVNLPLVYSFSNFGIYAIFLAITFARQREYSPRADRLPRAAFVSDKGESV